MILAVTASRNGMNGLQETMFEYVINTKLPTRFLHGACVGGDEQAARMVYNIRKNRCLIVAYPGKSAKGEDDGKNVSKEALHLSDSVKPADTHFARNRKMVLDCDWLVVIPWQERSAEPEEGKGGGTWYTAQYCMKHNKPLTIIWPDGSMEERLTI